eukprot:CAMPEP_0116840962 /NCGR_PEP_ID=MMETSP0418-20121206/10656_1 /TAXON_ID=1158023 /ORGANISM="Astrosyne radiata, Strain 13vi08-1A" /LENGTH=270 /DNA_ID=CAMNT_0004471327 /DNA_START=180 /DNA_END=992 /DNA_ORIENTATION=+
MVDFSSLFAACFFFLSNALTLAVIVRDRNNYQSGDIDRLYGMEAPFIIDEWRHQIQRSPLFQAAGVLNAMAWFSFCAAMMKLSWSLSKGGTRLVGVHFMIVSMVLLGSMTELIARLMSFGEQGLWNYVYHDFELSRWLPSNISLGRNDYIGWKVIQLVSMANNGFMIWVDAFEWFCLVIILWCVFYSVAKSQPRMMPMWWARWGLLISLLALLNFVSDGMRYDRWVLFSGISLLVTLINSVFFLPVWCFAMAIKLPGVLYSSKESDTATE